MLNFSESCQRNQQPILEQLTPWLEQSVDVLEIGSGSGQHALHFSSALPALRWQCTDRSMWLAALQSNIQEATLDNDLPAKELDVNKQWPQRQFDMIYTANSLHIMGWDSVELLFSHLAEHLHPSGYFCCYGPFKYNGEFTSHSNANFELWLKSRAPQSGVRDFEALQQLAQQQQLSLVTDIPMPANNQLLIWQKMTKLASAVL